MTAERSGSANRGGESPPPPRRTATCAPTIRRSQLPTSVRASRASSHAIFCTDTRGCFSTLGCGRRSPDAAIPCMGVPAPPARLGCLPDGDSGRGDGACSWHGAAVLQESKGGDGYEHSLTARFHSRLGPTIVRSVAMRINLIHIAPLLAAGAAAVAISAAPPAAAAPVPAEKICTESVSGSQCESAGDVEINNTPTTHFTPQYPMLGDDLLFHHGRRT